MKILAILSVMAVASRSLANKDWKRFPKDFLFGCSTASYQIEGAWNEDGKGENIWDHLTHNNPELISDMSNGDIAANSYHNYKRDVEIMRELGLDAYRFSLSWARILPTGLANEVNPAGIEYYNNLINEMLKYNIKPMVTLYHWDLPQKLQELGGFLNPLFGKWFEDYARIAFENFGDRVKLWITFNEPREICYQGYGSNTSAPLVNSAAFGTYLCAKHLVLAHANAYHAYNNDFKPKQGGECGITFAISWYDSLTNRKEDKLAAELKRQGEYGLYTEPIFSAEGGFPKDLVKKIAEKSAQQGYSKSRLPEFTEEEKAWARGASDFIGINHYTGELIAATEFKTQYPVPSFRDDLDVGVYIPEHWPKSAASGFTMAPNSLLYVLIDIHHRYNAPKIYVTGNGWAGTPEASLMDDDRIRYYRAALQNALTALDLGINLKGYMAWSLFDNFEWTGGYTLRFGLYHVNFEDPARTRTPRKSAFVYKNIVKNRYIDYSYQPESMTMTIDEGH